MAVQAAIPVTETFAPPAWGSSHPIGAVARPPDGVNVSVYAKRASAVDVLLFDGVDDGAPRVIELDRRRTGPGRTGTRSSRGRGRVRSTAFEPMVRSRRNAACGSTRSGPARPVRPRGRGPGRLRRASVAESPGGDVGRPMKSVVVDPRRYDWEGDRRWAVLRDTVIYEAHVTRLHGPPELRRRPGARGTYAGFIEKIPYLVNLGVTAVELLPVFQFDPLAAPAAGTNYWGYQPVSFFAPHAAVQRPSPAPRARSTSSGTSSRRSTGPASRSSSTSSTTTRPRAAPTGRRSASAVSRTRSTTSSSGRPVPLRRLQRHRQHAQR